MINIEKILKEFGLDIPADKKDEFIKKISENYVTIAEHEKKVSKLETDRNNWKSKSEAAELTLEKFKDIDPDEIKKELANWKQKAETVEEDFKNQIYERDFSDALKAELDSIKFSSESAKKAVTADIKDAGLKLKDGKILGLSDLIEQIKEKDKSAFVDEETEILENNKAKFTQQNRNNKSNKYSMSELMKMKNENPSLDITQFM